MGPGVEGLTQTAQHLMGCKWHFVNVKDLFVCQCPFEMTWELLREFPKGWGGCWEQIPSQNRTGVLMDDAVVASCRVMTMTVSAGQAWY